MRQVNIRKESNGRRTNLMLAAAPARERGAGEVDKEASSVATEETNRTALKV